MTLLFMQIYTRKRMVFIMIQDIAPHHYDNTYSLLPPRPQDYALCYEPHKAFLRREPDGIAFPTFQDLASHDHGLREHVTYLFSIDGRRFYLADHLDPLPLSGFAMENTEIFRLAEPQHLAFAGITGYQLYQWYRSCRFCGSCGAVMKKDGKILWAWTFWNVAADGTSIKPVTTAGYDFAPMDIGQATTQFDTWVANKNGANPDVVYRTTNLYQWGRYMPNFWTSYWTVTGGHDGANAVTNEQCLAILTNPLSYTDAMANPVGMILAVTDATDQANWCSDDVKDFWGSTTGDREKEGIKSIYDPCPKGWRVADTKALSAIVDACPAVGSGYSYIDTAGYPGIRIGDNSFICAGYINGKTSDNGRLANMGGANTGNTSGASHGLLWSNVCGAVQGQAFYFRPSSGKVAPKINSYNKSISAPVRCQVDRDNR